MRHLRRIKCLQCGNDPHGDEPICPVCRSSDWIWHCDLHGLSALNSQGCEQCGILFNGCWYFHEADLACALIKNWDGACKILAANSIVTWVKIGLGNDHLANRIGLLSKQGELQADAALTATLALLNPSAPLYWRGRALSQMDFLAKGEPADFANAEMASSLLASDFTKWISDHSSVHWVSQIMKFCQERAPVLELAELQMATPLNWWFLLADSDSLIKKAEKIRSLYVTSRNDKIAALFSKPVLTDLEALSLITTSEGDFLMPGNAWEELITLLIPTLEELKLKASLRPCSRLDLQAVEQDLTSVLEKLRSQREQFRPRQEMPTEPPGFLIAATAVKSTLHQALQAHDRAQMEIRRLRNLINRGHNKRAVALAATVRPLIAEFSDLNLDFVQQAEFQYHKQRRRILILGGIWAGSFILTFLIVKFFKK